MPTLSQERINEIVKRHRPRGWRVVQSKRRWESDSALADSSKRTLYVPTLKCDESLFLYLHEVGHVVRGHFTISPSLPHHIEEFEAELFAVHVFRAENIPVTKYIRDCIRERLCLWIARDTKNKVPIKRHIARWANYKVKNRGRCSR